MEKRITVGMAYTTLGGRVVVMMEGIDIPRGYETVIDHLGQHRYNRSTHDADNGRVTGAATLGPGNIDWSIPARLPTDAEILNADETYFVVCKLKKNVETARRLAHTIHEAASDLREHLLYQP